MRGIWAMGLLVPAALAAAAAAQEREAASPYFECPYINYFDSDCPQLRGEEGQAQPPADEGEGRAAGEGEGEDGQERLQEVPEHLLPLFPKESLAPDTPDPYRLLLLRPTLGNARRYVRWYSRRMSRIREAQELIAIAGREFLAERPAGD